MPQNKPTEIQTINVLSWGGGTQSTALMLKMLEGNIVSQGVAVKPDYIIFADTGDESLMTYNQILNVQKYVKATYGFDIIIVRKTKIQKTNQEIIDMVKEGLMSGTKYRSSEYADLYQNHVLFYQGVLDRVDIVPHWVINKNGDIGKLMGRQCTVTYKITQIMREIRRREKIKSFSVKKHKINVFIGFSVDEIIRLKPSPLTYAENKFPLVDLGWSKEDCIQYIMQKLNFRPHSSVCNICYANDFNKVYDIYKNDPESWNKLLVLDDAMAHKPKGHRIHGDVYMFHWQIKMLKRLKDLDMDEIYKYKNMYHQLSIFEMEEAMACMGGCFL